MTGGCLLSGQTGVTGIECGGAVRGAPCSKTRGVSEKESYTSSAFSMLVRAERYTADPDPLTPVTSAPVVIDGTFGAQGERTTSLGLTISAYAAPPISNVGGCRFRFEGLKSAFLFQNPGGPLNSPLPLEELLRLCKM